MGSFLSKTSGVAYGGSDCRKTSRRAERFVYAPGDYEARGRERYDGLILEEHMSPPGEFPETEFLTHIIVVKKGNAPVPLFWKENGRENGRLWIPGGVGLCTATLQTGVRWEGDFRASVLRISIPMMERAMPEPFAQRPIELITIRAGERDSVLEHMISALGALFESYPSSERIAVESLCNATAVYLAQRYGTFSLQADRYRSGLTQDRLSRVLDYIEAYLGEDLSLTELSRVACLSHTVSSARCLSDRWRKAYISMSLLGGLSGLSRCCPRVRYRLRTLRFKLVFRSRANSLRSSNAILV